MVRTKAGSVSTKAVGAKASSKVAATAIVTGNAAKVRNHGNSYHPRETPGWQKPITFFMKKDAESSKDDVRDETEEGDKDVVVAKRRKIKAGSSKAYFDEEDEGIPGVPAASSSSVEKQDPVFEMEIDGDENVVGKSKSTNSRKGKGRGKGKKKDKAQSPDKEIENGDSGIDKNEGKDKAAGKKTEEVKNDTEDTDKVDNSEMEVEQNEDDIIENTKDEKRNDEQFASSNEKVVSSDEKVASSNEKVASSDEEIASSDEKIASSDEKVASCDDKVASSNEKVASSDEEIASSDEKIASSDEKVASSDEKVASSDEKVASSDEKVASTDTGEDKDAKKEEDIPVEEAEADNKQQEKVVKKTSTESETLGNSDGDKNETIDKGQEKKAIADEAVEDENKENAVANG